MLVSMSKSQQIPGNMLRFSKSWNIASKYVFFIHRLFYKSISVEGLDNIPQNRPIIFAPNHQNALMDPMLILATTKQQVVFLARADIFRNRVLRTILYRLKILPVYRIRDGKENLIKNDDSFDYVSQVLEHKRAIALFPEAQHTNKRHILGLKKGVPRVAFMAEERNNFTLGVLVIPVGIYFSRYNTFRSVAHVRYGTPIEVQKFAEMYRENEQKAQIALRDEIAMQLHNLAINISNLKLYNMYESLRTLFVKQCIKQFKLGKLTQLNSFRADKITIAAIERYETENIDGLLQLNQLTERFELLKKQYRLSNQSIEKPKLNMIRLIASSLLLLVTIPVFLYGFINNFIGYIIPKILVLKIKDKQFHSSVKFVWGLFVLPLFYLIQTLIFYFATGHLVFSLIYIVSLPISGFAAQAWFEWLVIVLHDYRRIWLRKAKPETYADIKELHSTICKIVSEIATIYASKA